MALPCMSALLYPACVEQVSIFTTTVFVLTTVEPNRCFYEEAVAGCTMPTNLTQENGFYPVRPPAQGNASVYHGELLIEGYVNMTVPQATKSIYLGRGAAGYLEIQQDDATVKGLDDHAMDTIVIGGARVKIANATVGELVFPRSDYTNLKIEDVAVRHPVRFSPHNGDEVVILDGGSFANLLGNVVSFLHPRGTVTISGLTEVIYLPRPGGEPFTIDGDATQILNCAELTGVFGEEYLTSYEAGDLVLEALEAKQMAQTLILPTVLAVVSVILVWGDRLTG